MRIIQFNTVRLRATLLLSVATLGTLFGRTYEVEYEILPPNQSESVVFKAKITEEGDANDTIAGCKYVIESRQIEPVEGEMSFSAYFDGNLYRLREGRLDEWHIDSIPGEELRERASSDFFTELLPTSISRRIEKIKGGGEFTCSISEGQDGTTVVSGEETRRGYVMNAFSYTLDREGEPVEYELTMNPGGFGEQSVTARYRRLAEDSTLIISEAGLASLYPDAFGKLRATTFTAESLAGEPLPEIGGRMPGGERYVHKRGGRFERPTLIVFFDAADDRAGSAVETIRGGNGSYDIIYCFSDNNVDSIKDIVGSLRAGETVLYGVRNVSRDFGVKEFPTILICESDGKVKEVGTGMNKIAELLVKNVH